MTFAEVMLVYGIKILLGCMYGYIFLHYYQGNDPWALHAHSIQEKQLLLTDPLQFFWEFTPATAIKNGTGFFSILGFYLADLEYCFQAKTLGIFNLISQDNYYVNVVLWNFIIFWGHYWLLSLFMKEFPLKRKLYFILVFLFPPAVFWLSGIRSDGLLFFWLSLLLLHFHQWLGKPSVSSLFLWVTGFIGVLIMRAGVAVVLVPALLSWWFSVRISKRPLLSYLVIYGLAGIIFFGSTLLTTPNLTRYVVDTQKNFLKLKGSSFHLDTLQPNLKSFASIFPQAAVNTFLRPMLWEAKGILQGMAALEILIFLALFLFLILKPTPQWKENIQNPMMLLLLFFGVSLYIFIGYTVPFPGAIVRYKIIPEIFLLVLICTCIKTPHRLRLK